MKMLRVIHTTSTVHPIGIVSTYCGAHSVPTGMTVDQATDDVVNVQLPRLIVSDLVSQTH